MFQGNSIKERTAAKENNIHFGIYTALCGVPMGVCHGLCQLLQQYARRAYDGMQVLHLGGGHKRYSAGQGFCYSAYGGVTGFYIILTLIYFQYPVRRKKYGSP